MEQKITDKLIDELVNNISLEKNRTRLRVTDEVECESGWINIGNLLNVKELTPQEADDLDNLALLNDFLLGGSKLIKIQKKALIEHNFAELYSLYLENEKSTKALINKYWGLEKK